MVIVYFLYSIDVPKQVVGIGSGGVGCGQTESEYGHKLTSGKVFYRLGWATGQDTSTPLAPPRPSTSQLMHAKVRTSALIKCFHIQLKVTVVKNLIVQLILHTHTLIQWH